MGGFFKKLLPKNISSRFFIILTTPVILSQMIFGYVFFGRHTETILSCVSNMIAGEMKVLLDVLETDDSRSQYQKVSQELDMQVDILENASLKQDRKAKYGRVYKQLNKALISKEISNFLIRASNKKVYVYAASDNHEDVVYKISFLRKKLYSRTTPIVIMWGAASAVVLLIIAFIFFKNQLRPIKRLAEAMYRFGHGEDDNQYKPEGAMEVRVAGVAFCELKTNFRQLLNDRMNRLAGVSHDLKTILTRLKLQLALMPKNKETKGLLDDVNMMEKITESFILHAAQSNKESFSYQNLFKFLSRLISTHDFGIHLSGDKAIEVCIKVVSFTRALENIISNAKKYANNLYISFYRKEDDIVIDLEDDGCGVDPTIANDIFDPFFSSSEARTKPSDGDPNVGLGLSITKDIILDHGGVINVVSSQKYGGARFTITIPIK